MTYGEFKARDAECNECPIKDAGLCPGGFHSDSRGEPIEPPCCNMDDDEDMDVWVDDKFEQIRRREEYEDNLYRLEKEKKAKNEAAREKRRVSARVVYDETHEIKRLRKRIQSNKAFMRFASSLSTAFAFADACMDGKGFDENAAPPKPKHPLEIENEGFLKKIAELEAVKKQKLVEHRKQLKLKEKEAAKGDAVK